MRGIILAGGRATRLRPCTKVTSKGLLPVYNRPMIYYPLNTLLRAGIRDILIIISPEHAGDYLRLLGSGKEFDARFTYEVQEEPRGLAEAFIIGQTFVGQENVAMILGDNIFADDVSEDIKSFKKGGRIFAKPVHDPQRFGVVEIDDQGQAISIEEKPEFPKSNLCITGLYVYDPRCADIAAACVPSQRGELEITDLHRWYMDRGELDVRMLKEEWIDAGTFDSLFEAQALAKNKLQDRMTI